MASVSVSIGEDTLTRLLDRGWIELRGGGLAREIRLTIAGLDALSAKVPLY